MDEEALNSWAAANRAALTLDFLAWIAQEQSEAASEERERLWALGSKLMAVREGLGERWLRHGTCRSAALCLPS